MQSKALSRNGMQSLVKVTLRYLAVYQLRGKPAAYYRRGGVSRRLYGPDGIPVDPGDTVALTAAWRVAHKAWIDAQKTAKAAADARQVRPGSIADLIARYMADDFQRLSPATRKDYLKGLKPLEALYGDRLVIGMRPHHVAKIQRAHATRSEPVPGQPGQTREVANVRQANRIITVLSILMTYARGVLGWRDDNPALRPGRLRSDTDGYQAWSAEAFDAFMICPTISEPLKRAAALGYYTGLRKGDCLTITRSARSGGWITAVPAKTKHSSRAGRMIREHSELTRLLDAAPISDAVTLLTRPDGRPWKLDHFNHAFAAAVKSAGLTGLSFHGLRKAMLVNLAEGEATDAEMDAIVPHSDPRVRQHYRASADQKKLAERAIAKLPRKR